MPDSTCPGTTDNSASLRLATGEKAGCGYYVIVIGVPKFNDLQS